MKRLSAFPCLLCAVVPACATSVQIRRTDLIAIHSVDIPSAAAVDYVRRVAGWEDCVLLDFEGAHVVRGAWYSSWRFDHVRVNIEPDGTDQSTVRFTSMDSWDFLFALNHRMSQARRLTESGIPLPASPPSVPLHSSDT
jgi:hypothetical protein